LMDLLLGRKEELEVLKEVSLLPSYQKLMMQLRAK